MARRRKPVEIAAASKSVLDVTVVLLEGGLASTAIGPIEVFHQRGPALASAARRARAPRFRVTIASLDGEGVGTPCALGLRRSGDPRREDRRYRHRPLLGPRFRGASQHAALFPWLREKATQGAYIAGVCTGAAYLAEAGLLDGARPPRIGRSSTPSAQRYPKVDWHPERLITEDRRCSAAAASTPRSISASTWSRSSAATRWPCTRAKALLINMPRASQSGYAVLPLSRSHGDDKIRKAEAYLERHYQRDVSIEQLAQHAHMSPRNFIRRFKAATGRLPGNYLQGRACRRRQGDAGGRRTLGADREQRGRLRGPGLLPGGVQALHGHDADRVPPRVRRHELRPRGAAGTRNA